MKRITAGILVACIGILAIAVVGQEPLGPAQPQIRASAATSQPASTRPAQERPLYAGRRADEWASYQAMHAYFLQRFVDGQGFGLERMVDFRDPRFRRLYADGRRYSVGNVQLISLNGGGAPFAYVTGIDVDKERIRHAAHEPIGDAEANALKMVKDGMTVVLTGNAGHREMIGAIRATAECARCHAVAEGTLLGAFRYPLRPEPVLTRQGKPLLPQQSPNSPPKQ